MTYEIRNSALGFYKMPEGYDLIQLDSGHWMWSNDEGRSESCISVDKWDIYYGAVSHADFLRRHREAKP